MTPKWSPRVPKWRPKYMFWGQQSGGYRESKKRDERLTLYIASSPNWPAGTVAAQRAAHWIYMLVIADDR